MNASEFSAESIEKEFSRITVDDWELKVFLEIDSTMSVARQRLRQGDLHRPYVAIARTQIEGRGRQGRAWSSTPGGLYATYMLPTKSEMTALSGFSLVVGVVIAELLLLYGADLRLKWPNDLVSSTGKKAGGILIEIIPINLQTMLLVGVGLNFDNQVDHVSATTIRDLGADNLSIAECSARLAGSLREALRLFLDRGLESFLATWKARDYLLGREVEIDEGSCIVKGIASGVTKSGALVIDSVDGQHEVVSGHILSISKAPGPGNGANRMLMK